MKTLITLIIFGICSIASATLLPPNAGKRPLSQKDVTRHTEQRFHHIIDTVLKSNKDILNKAGYGDLVIIKEWSSPDINAAISLSRAGQFKLNIYGGLGRVDELSDDGFALILCHELGHLLGGAPTVKPLGQVSSEGQADYYATMKCFKRLPQLAESNHLLPELVIEKCKSVYDKKEEIKQCLRSAKAQLSVIDLMKELSNSDLTPAFDTPDPYVRMFILFNGYPNIQCRLDTLWAGSLCPSDPDTLHDQELYNFGNCSTWNGYENQPGLRPQCWYVEREDKI